MHCLLSKVRPISLFAEKFKYKDASMSLCDQDDTPTCKQSTIDAATLKEGKWVGITIGLWVLVLLIAWVIRTCTQPHRRQRAMRKLICCYDKHPWSDSAAPNADNRSCCENGAAICNGQPPPSYLEAISSEFTLEDVLHHENELSDEDSDDDYDYHDDETSWSSNNESFFTKNRRFRKRHSRISLSSLSITLATIEEDVNEAKHNSQPEFHIHEPPTALRSLSLPDRMSSMAGQDRDLTFDVDTSTPSEEKILQNGVSLSNGRIHSLADEGKVAEDPL